MAALTETRVEFFRRWLMGRPSFDPKEFGIDMEKDAFVDQMVDDFNDTYRGMWTIDELLLHPHDAIRFCENVRYKRGYFAVPNDVILRSVMQRRKNPSA